VGVDDVHVIVEAPGDLVPDGSEQRQQQRGLVHVRPPHLQAARQAAALKLDGQPRHAVFADIGAQEQALDESTWRSMLSRNLMVSYLWLNASNAP
jgi:hypothetical protein